MFISVILDYRNADDIVEIKVMQHALQFAVHYR